MPRQPSIARPKLSQSANTKAWLRRNIVGLDAAMLLVLQWALGWLRIQLIFLDVSDPRPAGSVFQ